MTEDHTAWRDASPPPWPAYDPSADNSDGIADFAPGLPPRRPWGLLIAIVTISLATAVAGVGVIASQANGTASPVQVPPPALTGPEWTKVDPSLTNGLVRVQVTATVEADGIVMTKDGLIATSYARMVGLGGSDIDIEHVELNVIADGGLPMRAKLIGFDATKDVAVLRVPGYTPASVAKLGGPVKKGSKLTLLDDQGEGFPVLGYPTTVKATNQQCSRSGAAMISRPRGFQFFHDTSEAEPGGALVRDNGAVLGMYYGGDTDLHCAVPIAEVAAVVSNVSHGKQTATTRVGPPGGLGIQLFESDDATYPEVSSIEYSDGLANAAGVEIGDVLTRVGDTSLRNSDLTTLGPAGVIRTLEPGQVVNIEWRSGGTTHRAKVKVGIGAQPNG